MIFDAEKEDEFGCEHEIMIERIGAIFKTEASNYQAHMSGHFDFRCWKIRKES